jgi:hypothetical protein
MAQQETNSVLEKADEGSRPLSVTVRAHCPVVVVPDDKA